MILKDSKLILGYEEAMDAYNQDNIELSIKLFEDLADQSVPEACQMLAFIYRTEESLKDNLESSKWNNRYLFLLKKYSDMGNSDASLTLGQEYQFGTCISKNNEKAIMLIKKAATEGLAEAQFHLSGLYRYGWGDLLKNYEKMSYWLDKAVTQDHLEALYQKGLDLLACDYNSSEGIDYIKRSAKLGFWVAEEYLDNLKK